MPKTGGGKFNRRGKANAFKRNKLNPGHIKPEAVESIMLVRTMDASGKISYMAGVRTQMAESFKASRAAYVPLIEQISIDFGIVNFATLTASMHGKRRHGTGFLQSEVEPVLAKAVKIEAARQAQKEALIKKSAKALALDRIASSNDMMMACPHRWQELYESCIPEAESLREGFEISTPRSKAFRTQAKGMVETFLGTFFNDIATILRPRSIVVERLDFRDGGLSPELNRLIANAGRFFFEQKLKDLHEKFGIEIFRVDSAYTSQECHPCGHIESTNRQGEKFQCKACGHVAHADENASDTIGERRPLPGTQKLVKSKNGFSWVAQGELPWLPRDEHERLKKQGIRFPRLWAALQARPKKNPKHQTAIKTAASYAACGAFAPRENRATAALPNPEKARPASTAALT